MVNPMKLAWLYLSGLPLPTEPNVISGLLPELALGIIRI